MVDVCYLCSIRCLGSSIIKVGNWPLTSRIPATFSTLVVVTTCFVSQILRAPYLMDSSFEMALKTACQLHFNCGFVNNSTLHLATEYSRCSIANGNLMGDTSSRKKKKFTPTQGPELQRHKKTFPSGGKSITRPTVTPRSKRAGRHVVRVQALPRVTQDLAADKGPWLCAPVLLVSPGPLFPAGPILCQREWRARHSPTLSVWNSC